MRFIESHKVNPANDQLEITVRDEPGAGGACHDYQIKLPDGSGVRLSFQNGPINETGVNGITHEALLAILIDRLEGFQAGQFASNYNAAALFHIQAAQLQLLERTRERMARGVEGTHQQ
jgi:hypothetical protein